jgi:CRISPR-associated protein Cas8b1/Cst1 subtype I-B
LLDWVNTIDEPKCLLVSELDDMIDGSVFLEILKNYLKEHKEKIYNICKEELEYLGNSKSEDKFEFINQVLKEFCEEDLINKLTYEYLNKVTSIYYRINKTFWNILKYSEIYIDL